MFLLQLIINNLTSIVFYWMNLVDNLLEVLVIFLTDVKAHSERSITDIALNPLGHKSSPKVNIPPPKSTI